MKREEQVCSPDLAKRLKELGVRQESAFYWVPKYGRWETGQILSRSGGNGKAGNWPPKAIAAFTVAELGELIGRLPSGVHLPERYSDGWWCVTHPYCCGDACSGHATEADARASNLIYLIEKGIVRP